MGFAEFALTGYKYLLYGCVQLPIGNILRGPTFAEFRYGHIVDTVEMTDIPAA